MSKRAFAFVAVAALAGVLAWWVLGRLRGPATTPDVAAPAAGPAPTRAAGDAPSVRTAAGPAREDAPAEREALATGARPPADVLAALRSLGDLTDAWPPADNARDFEHCDLSALKRAVEEAGLTGRELREAIGMLPPTDSLRRLALAAFAYLRDVDETDKAFLLEATRNSYLDPAVASGEYFTRGLAGQSYAALFALRMHGADAQLGAATVDMLERHSAALHQEDGFRDLAIFAMSRIESAPGAELQAELRRLTTGPPEMLLTSAAWQARARTGSGSELLEVVQKALGGNGHAREGLEAARDPALIDLLANNLRAGDESVYARHLAVSSAIALLDMPDPRAFDAFASLASGPPSRIDELLEESLGRETTPAVRIAPASLGAALSLQARLSGGDEPSPLARALDQAIERRCDQILHAVVPARDVQTCLEGLRGTIGGLDPESRGFSKSLQILAEYGNANDARRVEGMIARLPAAEQAPVRETLDRRH